MVPVLREGLRDCFVFVCERGELEMEAMLLAASFRMHYGGRYELVAFASEGEWAPCSRTRRILEDLDVRIEPLRNKHLEGRERTRGLLMTNKFPCIRVETDAPWITYLDTDHVLVRPFEMPDSAGVQFGARLLRYFGAQDVDNKWTEICAAVGLEVPKLRFRVARKVDGVRESLLIPPFFNGGLIRLDARIAARYADEWEACWGSLVQSAPTLFPGRPRDWERFEQLAVTLAMHRLGLTCEVMSHDLAELPLFHYSGGPEQYVRLHRSIHKLAESHPQIQKMLPFAPRWRSIFWEGRAQTTGGKDSA